MSSDDLYQIIFLLTDVIKTMRIAESKSSIASGTATSSASSRVSTARLSNTDTKKHQESRPSQFVSAYRNKVWKERSRLTTAARKKRFRLTAAARLDLPLAAARKFESPIEDVYYDLQDSQWKQLSDEQKQTYLDWELDDYRRSAKKTTIAVVSMKNAGQPDASFTS